MQELKHKSFFEIGLEVQKRKKERALRPIHILIFTIAGISFILFWIKVFSLVTNMWKWGETVVPGDPMLMPAAADTVPWTGNVIQGDLRDTRHWPVLVITFWGIWAPFIIYGIFSAPRVYKEKKKQFFDWLKA